MFEVIYEEFFLCYFFFSFNFDLIVLNKVMCINFPKIVIYILKFIEVNYSSFLSALNLTCIQKDFNFNLLIFYLGMVISKKCGIYLKYHYQNGNYHYKSGKNS